MKTIERKRGSEGITRVCDIYAPAGDGDKITHDLFHATTGFQLTGVIIVSSIRCDPPAGKVLTGSVRITVGDELVFDMPCAALDMRYELVSTFAVKPQESAQVQLIGAHTGTIVEIWAASRAAV